MRLSVRSTAKTVRLIGKYHSSSRLNARVLTTDGVDDVCVDIFRSRGHTVDNLKTMPESELIKIIGNYDGLVVRSATKVTPALLKHAVKMRVVGRAGVGIDNINVAEATRLGILVMNTPDGNTVSTAQLTMSLLANLARNIPAANMSIKEGKWDRKSFSGVEISGKTLGIIGCGRIGQVVANSANAMGMTVLGYDPVMTAEALAQRNIQASTLDQIWAKSDFITVHTPLTLATKNLIDDATLAKCKQGVRVINCARGGIVDEGALLRGLVSGKVAGAALDVFTSEPPAAELRELLAHPRVICTPHLGASTDEAQVNVARDVAQQMCDLFDEKEYVGIVNVSYMAAASLPQMQPFMRLAETLGTIQAQMSSSKITNLVLKTWGGRDVSITSPSARQLLEAQTLKGVLRRVGAGVVPDIVSAPAVARDQGIESSASVLPPQLLEGLSTASPYRNLLSVEVTREDGSTGLIAGSVFGDEAHIVQMDHYDDIAAFKPDGNYVLTFRNEDRPGAVAQVLEVLHRANVNVAGMNVGRASSERMSSSDPSRRALCFMALDDVVPANALKALHALPGLSQVALIQLA